MDYGIVLILLLVLSVIILMVCNVTLKQSTAPKQVKTFSEWEKILTTSALISGDNTEINQAIEHAKSDKNILSQHSVFYASASQKFGDNLIEWLNDDLAPEEVPSAIFKTVLCGFGYMAYLDWKSLSDPKEVLGSLNRVLRTLGQSVVHENEICRLEAQMSHINDMDKRSSEVIKTLNSIVKNLDLEIVWFDENSDAYAFFVMSPDDSAKLAGFVLDSDHQFISAPTF